MGTGAVSKNKRALTESHPTWSRVVGVKESCMFPIRTREHLVTPVGTSHKSMSVCTSLGGKQFSTAMNCFNQARDATLRCS